MFSTKALLLAGLISTALAGPWANICAGKSSNEIRTCDRHGCGQYSAQRSQRPHQGVDILCSAGSTVYAPFTGMIVGQEKPYQNKNAINNGVRISGREITTDTPIFNNYYPDQSAAVNIKARSSTSKKMMTH
uniref:Leukocyte cell derived chemotaxin 2 n=1 Tax=Gorilla gorilla gorilla TaxID=9595 RepID=A0A2I2YY87_GORGO